MGENDKKLHLLKIRFIHENAFDTIVCEMFAILFRGGDLALCLQHITDGVHYVIRATSVSKSLKFVYTYIRKCIMTSSNGSICRITGLLCGELTGHVWIPRTKANEVEFEVFFDLRLNKRLSKQSRRRSFETPSYSSWRHCNVTSSL